MGVKVGTLAKRVEKTQMRVGEAPEDVVNIEYRPGAVTLGALDRLSTAARDEVFDPAAFEELLSPILVSWDLLDDDGESLPINREGLHKLPIEFIGELVALLSGAASVDEEEGKVSDVTSVQTDAPVTSLSGTSSSEQPST